MTEPFTTRHSVTDGRPTLVYSMDVHSPPADVWRAITDPAFTRQYFYGYLIRSEFAKGAAIVYEVDNGDRHMEGVILDIEPARRLSMSVRVFRDADTAKDAPSRITWELEPIDGGCRLTVVHDDFSGETPTFDTVRGGWPNALKGLKEFVETGSAAQTIAQWPDHVRARLGMET